MLVEILLILFLLVLNGVFAMSEIAVVSARRSRLRERAEAGSGGARRALRLAEEPNRFLATVQVGITLVGILAGAYGGATLAEHLAARLERYAALAPYAEAIALFLVVLAITYFSLVIGELVPKRIALHHPEAIAARVAGPMHALSRIGWPLVWVLTTSTEALLRVLRIRESGDPPVTEGDIAALLEQGAETGVIEEEEQELVERVFWLADQRVDAVMVPRVQVAWLDVNAPPDVARQEMLRLPYSRFVVADGSLDRVVGVVHVRDAWRAREEGRELDLRALATEPLFVPETTAALRLVEEFRRTGTEVALVVSEYGGIEGVVTLHDLTQEVLGDFPAAHLPPEPCIVARDDGSLLVDGALAMEELREALGLPERRSDERPEYRTLGGFVFTRLGRVPQTGDRVPLEGFTLEVVDMDRRRVDKVLVTPPAAGEGRAEG
ncbi:MAG TPA: hemolysin family protein [Longimicrobiaceae bacterium]|nr:hemolysin family protein [Longimicrobiaceae bacterium]